MDLDLPFRGSAAVAAGLVTPAELRGPRFTRMFPDVHVRVGVAHDLALRSRAAFVHVEGHGILTGYSAAELLGASCGPEDAPAEVTVPGSERRARPGLRVHRFRPADGEVLDLDGLRLTTPLRSAYDLARREDVTEAVVAVDALARGRFTTDALLGLALAHRGDRGLVGLRRAVRLADPRAQSPMETRIRVAIARYRLPAPELQYPVGPYLLDLAYPRVRLAVEYDGREHLVPERALRDLQRQADLTAAGWWVLRFRARTVHDPHETALRVHRELVSRGWRLPNVSPAW